MKHDVIVSETEYVMSMHVQIFHGCMVAFCQIILIILTCQIIETTCQFLMSTCWIF